MNKNSIEPAIHLGEDSEQQLALLKQIHTATVQGASLPARPRAIVDRSWQRMLKTRMSVDLDIPETDLDGVEKAIEDVRLNADVDLSTISRYISAQLEPILTGTKLVGILTTPDSRIVQRFGDGISLNHADRLGFVRGARWGENVVGTNAIGTAAFARQPVQIHGPEHWCLTQHRWSCSAAPILDPRTGSVLGILDISGPVDQAHPALLGMVQALAHQVELMLRESHLKQLERVRSHGLAATIGLTSPWVLAGRWGWVAASSNIAVGERIGNGELTPGHRMLEGIGAVEITRAGPGFLVQPAEGATRANYRLNRRESELSVWLGDACEIYKLSPKHRDILSLLVQTEEPLTLEEIARKIWGADAAGATHTSTARAEISRLRKRFPELLSQAPYRLKEEVHLL